VTDIIHDRGKEEPEYDLTEEEEAEIEAGFAEIERGEWIDGDWVQQELRRRIGSRPKV
jgi:predicted transcriptional regulator